MTGAIIRAMMGIVHAMSARCRGCLRRGSECDNCLCATASAIEDDVAREVSKCLSTDSERLPYHDRIVWILATTGRAWPARALAIGKTASVRSHVLEELVEAGEIERFVHNYEFYYRIKNAGKPAIPPKPRPWAFDETGTRLKTNKGQDNNAKQQQRK